MSGRHPEAAPPPRLLPPPSCERLPKVEEERRYALLEYVSHLTAKDYEATLNDLIVLGFIPKEIGDDPKKVMTRRRFFLFFGWS